MSHNVYGESGKLTLQISALGEDGEANDRALAAYQAGVKARRDGFAWESIPSAWATNADDWLRGFDSMECEPDCPERWPAGPCAQTLSGRIGECEWCGGPMNL